MSDMIERVAQAIFDAVWAHTGREWPRWMDSENSRAKDEARIAARAAIEAMREPTEAVTQESADNSTDEIEITPEMIEAGLSTLWDYDPRFGNERDIVSDIFRLMYHEHLRLERIRKGEQAVQSAKELNRAAFSAAMSRRFRERGRGMSKVAELTATQAAFMEQLSEIRHTSDDPEDSWLLFINAGFSMEEVKDLHDRGLIYTSLQMGMPAARLKPTHPHLIDGEFQSDKYPACPRGKVPLSCKDPMAQDLLWEYAQRRRADDGEFSEDLEAALRIAGFVSPTMSEKQPD